MKKIIIPIAIATLGLGLSGCSLSKTNPMEVKAEETIEVVAYDFNYSVELAYEETLKATIKIENDNNSFIPLNVKATDLFIVKLVDGETGVVLKTQKVALNERTQIQRMETLVKDVYFDVPGSGKYEVVVEQQLKNNSNSNYDQVESSVSKSIEAVKEAVDYRPISYAKKRNVQYEYKNAKGKKFHSKYEYYDRNKIQGVSSEYGVIIYAQTEEGLKMQRIADYVGDINGLEFINENDMELIIPNYPELGQKWEVNGKQFTVMGLNSTVKTTYGTLTNLKRIQVIQKKQIKDYFFDEELGLVKIVQKRSNSKKEITELQLSGVEIN